MALADIREQIKTIVAGVAGVGVVHDYARLASDWGKFLSLFQDPADGKVRCWMITRRSTPSQRDTMPTLRRSHEFRIIGIYSLKDAEATELEFQDLVERIQTAFDSNNTLNGSVLDSDPIQVDLVEPRMFGSVLCHYAQLTLRAHERVRYH